MTMNKNSENRKRDCNEPNFWVGALKFSFIMTVITLIFILFGARGEIVSFDRIIIAFMILFVVFMLCLYFAKKVD